jgi:hypothetical protein
LAADVIADLWQMDEAAVSRALEGLRAVGLLVESPGGWTTPRWSEHQPDPSNSERQRAWRERNRKAAESVTPVTVTGRYVTADNGVSRDVTPDRTGQDITGQDMISRVVVVDPSRAPAREATGGDHGQDKSVDAAIAHAPAPEGLDAVVEAWRRAMPATSRRGVAMFLPLATVEVVARLVATHGAQRVTDAIAEAVRSRGEVPSPGYVEAILTGRGRKSGAYRDPGRKPVAESPKPPISEDIPF